MNAGLSSLAYLKAQLLAEALRADTSYDDALTLIGLGVAALFEKHCNRKFYRTAADTYDHSADCDHLFVPRYPIESVASVAKQTSAADGFEAITDLPLNWEAKTGFVYFGVVQGTWAETLRVTYTGGYWWDTTEDASDTLPSGATAVPDDLRLAWTLQCREIWNHRDPLGTNIARDKNEMKSLRDHELLPQVLQLIAGYRRFQIT